MRGPVLFLVSLVAAATLAVLAMQPGAPREDPGDGEDAPERAFLPFRPARPEARTVPLRGDDSLAASATVCLVNGGACELNVGSAWRDVPLAQGRDLVAMEVEVRWAPASAATQRLVASLLSCEGSCPRGAWPVASAEGPSPLVLSVPSEGAAGVVTLRVAPADRAPGPAVAQASPTAQPFAFAGTATYR